MNLLIMASVWLFSQFNFHLLNRLQLGFESISTTVILTSITHIVAQFASVALYEKYGLKIALYYSFGLAGVGGLIMHLLSIGNEWPWMFTALIIMMNFGVSSATNLCYIGHKECFPTLFATSSFGYCNFFGGLVAMWSFVAKTAKTNED